MNTTETFKIDTAGLIYRDSDGEHVATRAADGSITYTHPARKRNYADAIEAQFGNPAGNGQSGPQVVPETAAPAPARPALTPADQVRAMSRADLEQFVLRVLTGERTAPAASFQAGHEPTIHPPLDRDAIVAMYAEEPERHFQLGATTPHHLIHDWLHAERADFDAKWNGGMKLHTLAVARGLDDSLAVVRDEIIAHLDA